MFSFHLTYYFLISAAGRKLFTFLSNIRLYLGKAKKMKLQLLNLILIAFVASTATAEVSHQLKAQIKVESLISTRNI